MSAPASSASVIEELKQAGAEPQVNKGALYRHYGTPIATCTSR